jgi:hypothetical protein
MSPSRFGGLVLTHYEVGQYIIQLIMMFEESDSCNFQAMTREFCQRGPQLMYPVSSLLEKSGRGFGRMDGE